MKVMRLKFPDLVMFDNTRRKKKKKNHQCSGIDFVGMIVYKSFIVEIPLPQIFWCSVS